MPITDLIVYGLYAAWALVLIVQIVITSWIWHLALVVRDLKHRIETQGTQSKQPQPQQQGDYNAFERRRFVGPDNRW